MPETVEMSTRGPDGPGYYWWAPTVEEIGQACLIRVEYSLLVEGLLQARCNLQPHPFVGRLPRGRRHPAELGGWWSCVPMPRPVAPGVLTGVIAR